MGVGEKEDDISLGQLSVMTRLSEPHISTALNGLAKANLISKKRGRYGQLISINKYYRTWQDWDTSWEFWSKEAASKSDKAPTEQKQEPESEPELTTEQEICYQVFVPTKEHWLKVCVSKTEFLRLYNLNTPNGLKQQFKEYQSKSAQRMQNYKGKKKPADFEFQDFDDVPDTGNSDFINGEFERIE